MESKRNITETEKTTKSLSNRSAVYQYFLDYCADTTIHGFKVKYGRDYLKFDL